mgnify:CR=1 FL=1|tara:strand:- start:1421 stop:2143 length:723 start_codon:yes stop_codon:yes gene_type:complete
MSKKKSVKMNQSAIPAAIRKAFGAQDELLIAEGKTRKKIEESNAKLGEALDSAGHHIFAITDSRENAKFATFWKRYSAMFTDAMKDEIEARWNAARAIILEMSSAHDALMVDNPDLYDWGRRKQEIARHMAWCKPSDNNKGKAAKIRASKCDTSGGVSQAKLKAGHATKETTPRKVDPVKSAKSDINKIGMGLTSIEADYISLMESYLTDNAVGTAKQRDAVRTAIVKAREALATLEGKI